MAFADQGKYAGDPRFTDVPVDTLLSRRYAATRAGLIDSEKALRATVEPGTGKEKEGRSTTNLTMADRWGNVVEYTLTIEQTDDLTSRLAPGWPGN